MSANSTDVLREVLIVGLRNRHLRGLAENPLSSKGSLDGIHV